MKQDGALRFEAFIARTVLHSTIEELRHRMTMRELRQWAAIYRTEPWGEERDAANIDALANVSVGLQTPRGQPYRWRRYTPDYAAATNPPQSLSEMKSAAIRITAMLGSRRAMENPR